MKDRVRYSIILVCLNPGDRILQTLASIYMQTYTDYEVVIKDGYSNDGTIEQLFEKLATYLRKNNMENPDLTMGGFQEKVSIHQTKDTGIYDAMNQAIAYAQGDYLLFLNAGDDFYQNTTLEEVSKAVGDDMPGIIYGNLYHKALETTIYASPEINDFTCYRNVPCHQTCFYKRNLFEKRGYEPKYNVRADYEHFLWCYYEEKVRMKYIPVIVAAYEGGGYSETKENRKKSAKQHREIVLRYMGKKKANHYRWIMWLTLQPIRSKIAESNVLSPLYNGLKTAIYKCRKKG